MRARALVALAIAWALVAVAPAAAQEGEEGAAHGLGAGAADPEPVHRPGRGGLPRLGDQLRPARQLQPEGPRPDRPGIAESWDDLARQEDGHLQAVRGAQVVRRPADHVEGRQVQPRDVRAQQPAVPQLRREHHLGRDAGRPDGHHQDQAARRADRRRPVRLHPARAHLGQAVGQVAHRRPTSRRSPIVGSGPYVVTRVPPRPHHPDDAQPVLPRARSRSSTRSSGSSTATTTPSSARSRSGEIDIIPEVQEAAFARLGKTKNIKAVSSAVAVVHAARVQPLQQAELPGREVQPGRPGPHGAPGDRLRDRPQAHQPDRLARHRVRGPRAAARRTTRRSTRSRPRTTRSTSTRPTRCSTRPAGRRARTASAAKGGEKLSFDLFVRSESPQNIQDARLVREMTKPIGVDFKVKIVSVGQAHRDHHAQGQGQDGAGLRHLHLGLGRRPLRPGPAAQPADHEGDRRAPPTRSTPTPSTTASTTSRPASSTRPSARRSSSQMIALSQRDLPYIVLTVDPVLQAYRTDKVAGVKRVLPAARRRRHLRPGRLRDDRSRWRPPSEAAGGGGERRRRQRADDRADRARAR